MNGTNLNDEQIACSYGYSYYPETRFDYDWQTSDFQARTIAIEDNMIGYKYGENNIAIQTDWKGKRAGFDLAANVEFRLAGANSPANPWHDLFDNPLDGTHWLNDVVLEKRVMVGFSASRSFGAWTLGLSALGGVAFDAMELRKPTVAVPPTVSPGRLQHLDLRAGGRQHQDVAQAGPRRELPMESSLNSQQGARALYLDADQTAAVAEKLFMDFPSARETWLALEKEADFYPFQSYAWLDTWYRTIGVAHGWSPAILSLERADGRGQSPASAGPRAQSGASPSIVVGGRRLRLLRSPDRSGWKLFGGRTARGYTGTRGPKGLPYYRS